MPSTAVVTIIGGIPNGGDATTRQATWGWDTTANALRLYDGTKLYEIGRNLTNGTGNPKTIVDGSATSLFEVVCATGEMVGGTFTFLVRASDGTDFQADAGIATYAAVSKAGTITRTVTYVAANEAKAVSAGTITLAFTMTDDTGKTTVKVQPTGSLTETTYTIEYIVTPIRGAVTIL